MDLETGEIEIVGSLQRVRNADGSRLEIQPPKTERGKRPITLPAPALEVLRHQRKRQLEDRLFVGEGWFDADYVFTNRIGQPLDPEAFTHTFSKLAGKVGLNGTRVHDLRHALATQLMGKLDPRMVADTLGHSTPAFTLSRYTHRRQDQEAMVARAIEDVLASEVASPEEHG